MTGIAVTTLVRPEIIVSMVDPQADKIGAAVSLPVEFPGTLGKEEIRCDFRRRSDSGAGGEGLDVRQGPRAGALLHAGLRVDQVDLSKTDHRKIHIGKSHDG